MLSAVSGTPAVASSPARLRSTRRSPCAAVAGAPRPTQSVRDRRSETRLAAVKEPQQASAAGGNPVLDGAWSCTAVLKEWASACEAIGNGEQIILLRKGGIREKGFKVSHRRFALYPSSFHNSESLLQPWAQKYSSVPASTPGEDASLRFVAECTGLWQTDDPAVLSRLAPFHCWGDGLLETRFKWRPTQPITVVELRAYRLPAPFVLKGSPDHGGCSSWIATAEAEGAVSGAGAAAALSDAAFQAKQAEVRAALKGLQNVEAIPLPA